MNKSKISQSLLNDVSILSCNKKTVYVLSNNFFKTKKFLDNYNYNYSSYHFANCFMVEVDYEDLAIFSNQDFISYILPIAYVQTQQKNNNIINIKNLTEDKYLGQNQTICFIDTGIFPHFDFIFPRNRIIKFIDLINDKLEPYDDNGHGTFVAGIACGGGILNKECVGFAPLSNIISIKALKQDGSSSSNTILDAMQWIYENHKVYNISVVCMSFGADYLETFDPLSKGAEALWRAGITVVAAAGNSGPLNKTIKSPGVNPNIITVGGLDTEKTEIANFSSRGPTIYGHKPDLIAPAVNLVACNNKIPLYTTMSGTSVATPIIASICLNIKSKFPKMTNNQIKNYLISNCKKITGNIDIEGAGYLCF